MVEKELKNMKREKQQSEQRLKESYETTIVDVKKQGEIEKQQSDKIVRRERETRARNEYSEVGT